MKNKMNNYGAGAKSPAWIDLRKSKGAQAPLKRFFCACSLYLVTAGCVGALSSAPFPFGGKVNPAQLATFSLTSDCGDKFITQKEAI